ncbi:hypothetical protein SLEP1_g54634 [Rubroshorea leprosula]|uniref:Uncharacterized protein n=1 Tax=Rubroshorea leprosula TaxID=152421 RepID=A0AAV5MD26_9ROSI|nr:hypothetical protein SLEP1_g54634 [Rubroshorea leprosula]
MRLISQTHPHSPASSVNSAKQLNTPLFCSVLFSRTSISTRSGSCRRRKFAAHEEYVAVAVFFHQKMHAIGPENAAVFLNQEKRNQKVRSKRVKSLSPLSLSFENQWVRQACGGLASLRKPKSGFETQIWRGRREKREREKEQEENRKMI